MATIPLKAVISYPFSGALYAFFEEQLNEYRTHPPTPHENHPYYRTLFGDQFPKFQELALTLTLLFDEVILVPADAKMPADKEFVNDEIRHQGLGLVSSWDFEARRSFEEPVTEDLEDAVIRKVLRRVPTSSRRQILENTRHEILLAARHSCPIVCFGGRRALIERILTREAEHIEIYDPASLSFAEEYLDLVGIIFNPRDFDILCELKHDKQMRRYAKSFLAAMDSSRNKRLARREMLLAMRAALESSKLAAQLSGVLDGSSKVLSIGGLIPFVSTFAGFGSIAIDGSSSIIQNRAKRHDWVEFGPQVTHLSSLKAIENMIEAELSDEHNESD